MRKRQRVLLLFDCPYQRPRGYDFAEEFKDQDNWYTENDVHRALTGEGHNVRLLGLFNDARPLFEEIQETRPDVVFNLAEVFDQKAHFDKNVAAILEMLGVPYTGASPACLLVCNDKGLSKKILRFHRVRVPRFYAFYRGHKVWIPKVIKLPVVIKPLCEEASRGISLASVVDNEGAFYERIRFIHDSMKMDAIAEEYIDGRELYVTIIGNKKLRVLPFREIKFGEFPEDEPRIATYKAKWDDKFRERWGIKSVFAGKLPNGMQQKIEDTCKRAYRALNMDSYARFDVRITPGGGVYVIEPNANPCIARIDEVAQSAEKIGLSYNELIRKLIALAFQRGR